MNDRNDSRERSVGALLASAVGDALGWPQEQNSRNADTRPVAPSDRASFRSWTRQGGSRFAPYDEVVGAGEYSDDTQLLLSVARSRLAGTEWHDTLAKVELPMWLAYERGGGAAIKRSARAWQTSRPPWQQTNTKTSQKDVDAYFRAGSNGAAMRALPHSIYLATESTFDHAARDVVMDAVLTHGHPRALIGALAQSHAAWYALRCGNTLGYGELLQVTRDALEGWTVDSLADSLPSDWIDAFDRSSSDTLGTSWTATLRELDQLLTVGIEGVDLGALGGDDVLSDLGCFDRKVNGSGTISAAAAIYLASRFAADPIAGLLHAAYLERSDTDTLASMVGGLLGAVHGRDWLGSLGKSVQDASSISELAVRLHDHDVSSRSLRVVSKKSIDQFWKALDDATNAGALLLPDGRAGEIVDRRQHRSKSKATAHRTVVVRTFDGQTLFLGTSSKVSPRSASQPNLPVHDGPDNRSRQEGGRVSVHLMVRDLAASRSFYVNVLGIRPTSETSTRLTLRDTLVLVQVPSESGTRSTTGARVALEMPTASALRSIEQAGVRVTARAEPKSARSWFRCLDPDSNVVEIWEPRGDVPYMNSR